MSNYHKHVTNSSKQENSSKPKPAAYKKNCTQWPSWVSPRNVSVGSTYKNYLVYHINRIKEKSLNDHSNRQHKSICRIKEKSLNDQLNRHKNNFCQNSTSFHDKEKKKKTGNMRGIEENFSQTDRCIYKTPQLTSPLMVKDICLPSKIKKRLCLLFTFLLNIILEVLSRTSRQEKNRHPNWQITCSCTWKIQGIH